MGIKEDRDDFNNTGWRGALRRLMANKDEGFVRLDPGGWTGDEVPDRPAPGSGPFIHFRRGYPPMRYRNSTPDDQAREELRQWEL